MEIIKEEAPVPEWKKMLEDAAYKSPDGPYRIVDEREVKEIIKMAENEIMLKVADTLTDIMQSSKKLLKYCEEVYKSRPNQ